MAIDPRISLAAQAPQSVGSIFNNALTNIGLTQNIEQQRQQAPFQNQLLQLQTELAQAQQPAIIQQAQQAANPLSQVTGQQQQMLQLATISAQNLKPAFDSNSRIGVISGLTALRDQLATAGAPQAQVNAISADIAQANTLEGFEELKRENQQFLQHVVGQQVGTASQRDFDTFKALEAKANQTGSEADIMAANQFGRQAGFVRPTEEEKADIKVSEAERKEIAKANAKRKQGFIDSGVEAADSVANIKRSISLLDTVKTGGLDKAAFAIRQAFGVEGADEGELSANLGRSVLAQLKPIFGAAFTAAEGDRLERIEAGFGRSPATNKRLLDSALKIAERAARRGLAAAEDQGDEFTANEIREAMAFEFVEPEDAEVQTDQVIQPQAQQAQFQEGQTATNPQTGQRIIFRNGQWVSL